GRAQVAAQHTAKPDARLGEEWLFESQPRAGLGDVLRGGGVAGQEPGGSAGGEGEKGEDGQGPHSHDGNGGQHPLQDQREHVQVAEKGPAASFSKGIGAPSAARSTDVEVGAESQSSEGRSEIGSASRAGSTRPSSGDGSGRRSTRTAGRRLASGP